MYAKIFILDLLIIIILIGFSTFIFFFQIESLTKEQKQYKFLAEKLKIVSRKVNATNPQIIVIDNPADFSNLNFSKELEKGDLIFIYKESGAGFFIDHKTERIIGVGEL